MQPIPRVSNDSNSSFQSAYFWPLVIFISCLSSYSPLYHLVALGEFLVSFSAAGNTFSIRTLLLLVCWFFFTIYLKQFF